MINTVITRFAPSPTGTLHIGGARTALFNYLFAAHNNGKFLLRMEDTDKNRSTKEFIGNIINALKWLDIKWDEEIIFQSKRNSMYQDAALKLINEDKAYYCFAQQEEIEEQRNKAKAKKESFLFKSPWRNANPKSYPKNIKPVIRFKSPITGDIKIFDTLQGKIVIKNECIDDMVLIRSDGIATYMIAVVVDDYEMKITHIIRGDDHLTNSAKQIALYNAFGWKVPIMTHIPLIHNYDGQKLSKRHGALSIEDYKKMGYLPEAISNYMLKLGWGHNNDEIISRKEAINWFTLEKLGKSPAKLDANKINYLNSYYLRKKDNLELTNIICEILIKNFKIYDEEKNYIFKDMDNLKQRSANLIELSELAKIYLVHSPIEISKEGLSVIGDCQDDIIIQVIAILKKLNNIDAKILELEFKNIASINKIKISEIIKPIRVLITGKLSFGSIFHIISIIGIDNAINRLNVFFTLKKIKI